MRKTYMAAAAALALCAALLAGCSGSNADDQNAAGDASAAPDTAVTDGADQNTAADSGDTMPSATPDASAAAGDGTNTDGTAYSAEGLGTVLDMITAYGADTAGGSLQTAQAAGELVRFAAEAGDQSATLGADAQAWLDRLNDDHRAALKTNWAAVREQARGIAADYDSQKGILGDAGVTTDFSALDMSGVDAFLNTLDGIIGK